MFYHLHFTGEVTEGGIEREGNLPRITQLFPGEKAVEVRISTVVTAKRQKKHTCDLIFLLSLSCFMSFSDHVFWFVCWFLRQNLTV